MSEHDWQTWSTHASSVRAYLRSVEWREDERAEVLAETALSASAVTPRRRDEPGVRSFFVGFAANLLRRRRREEQKERALAGHLELVPTPPPDPEATFEQREELARVWSAIASLPQAQQQMLRLLAIDGLSPSEAARQLGIPEATARTRLFQARKSLDARLDRHPTARRTRAAHLLLALALLLVGGAALATVVLPLVRRLTEQAESPARRRPLRAPAEQAPVTSPAPNDTPAPSLPPEVQPSTEEAAPSWWGHAPSRRAPLIQLPAAGEAPGPGASRATSGSAPPFQISPLDDIQEPGASRTGASGAPPVQGPAGGNVARMDPSPGSGNLPSSRPQPLQDTRGEKRDGASRTTPAPRGPRPDRQPSALEVLDDRDLGGRDAAPARQQEARALPPPPLLAAPRSDEPPSKRPADTANGDESSAQRLGARWSGVARASEQPAPTLDTKGFRLALAAHLSHDAPAAIAAWTAFLITEPRGPLEAEARFRRAEARTWLGDWATARGELSDLLPAVLGTGLEEDIERLLAEAP